MTLKMVSTLSTLEDVRSASRQAAEHAVAALGAPPVLAFVTAPAVLPDLARVGPAVLEVTGRDCALVGCSHGSGFFCGQTWSEHGVGLMLLGGDVTATIGIGSGLASSPLRAIDRAAAPLREAAVEQQKLGRSHQTVICVADVFSASGDLVAMALRDALGPEPVIAGGMAGDSNRFRATQVLAGEDAMQDAAVLVGLHTSTPSAVAAHHGYRPVSRTLSVTRASGRTLHELDGRPALEVILEEIGRAGGRPPSKRSELLRFLSAWPLGFARPLDRGEPIVRGAIQLLSDGALAYSGDVPPGYPTFVMHVTKEDLTSAARKTVEDVKSHLGGRIAGMMIFSCSGRLRALDNAYQEELSVFETGSPLFGLHTYGEFCQSSFHNNTAVALGFANP